MTLKSETGFWCSVIAMAETKLVSNIIGVAEATSKALFKPVDEFRNALVELERHTHHLRRCLAHSTVCSNLHNHIKLATRPRSLRSRG